MLVTDQLEKAVWRVDLAAGTRRRIGREGKGPNEYGMPMRVLSFRADSTVLVDLGNLRLAVLGPGLRMGRTIPLLGVGGLIPRWTDTLGHYYGDGGSAMRRARARDRRLSDMAPLLRLAESGDADTVAMLKLASSSNAPVWYAWDAWAVGPDGRVLVVRNGDDYRVEWYGPGIAVVRGPAIDEGRIEVTAADRRIFEEKHPGGGGNAAAVGGQGGRRPAAYYPDHYPFADPQDVWVDMEGRGWVGRHQHQSEERPLFDIFDRSGRRVARLRLPAGREVVGFGPGWLYAVRVDEVDLQWLERYDITRDAMAGTK